MACSLLAAGIALLLPLCARLITQTVLDTPTPDPFTQIGGIGLLMLALIAADFVFTLGVDYHGHRMGGLIERDMRAELFNHYQKLPFSFHDQHRTGQLMSRLTSDLFTIGELCHHMPEDFAIGALKFIGAFVILVSIDLELTLVVFAFLPVMAAYALYFHRRMTAALRVSRQRIGDINAQTEETLAGIRVVKSFTNEAIENEKFAYENQRFVESRNDGYRSEAYFFGGLDALSQSITIAVVFLGGVGIAQASLTAVDLVTFLMCVAIMIDPVKRVMNISRLLQEGITGFERFMEIIETAPDITDAPDAQPLPPVRGDIEFEGVTFRYQDDQREVFTRLNLTIRAGEYVALVGASGVGKTTLAALVPRFYDVTHGRICIDGHDIRDVTLRSLRGQIGLVQQDVYLFPGTVADNIAYGRPGASRDEVIQAAKDANAHDFINALPNGYDTDIGQRGVKLSGGQRQRLSIARALIKNPPILIFDEATSALDNESESAIQAVLEGLAGRCTLIVIAHRLSTIRRAERILVLTEGGIAEEGAHAELLDRGGAYAALYNRQGILV
jgi:ATP-binding cassette subfamily B protein